MRKLLSRLTILALLLGLLTAAALAADVEVNGTQVLNTNASDVLNDGTVSYDADTQTLTLNGANIDTSSVAISSQQDLTIVLEGENTLTSSSSHTVEVIGADLTIKGPGSLTVKNTYATGTAISGSAKNNLGGNVTICDGANVTVEGYVGINIVGALTIRGATVNATATGKSNGALVANGDITIQSSAVTANADQSGAKGIYSSIGSIIVSDKSTVSVAAESDGLNAYKEVKISNSKVEVESGNFAIYGYADISVDNSTVKIQEGNYGIYSNSSSIIVSNGSMVSVVAGNGALTAYNGQVQISGGSTVEGQTDYPAITGMTGVFVDSSNMTVTTEKSNGVYSEGDIVIINGATVKSETVDYPSIYTSEGVRISGSDVNVISDYGNGFYIKSIEISDGAKVTGVSGYPTIYATENISVSASSVDAKSYDDAAILSEGDLTIENGSDVTAEAYFAGILIWGQTAISDSTVDAYSEADVGILSADGITISGDKTVVTAQSDAPAYEDEDDEDGGVYLYPGIRTYGDIEITGGNVTAMAREAGGIEAGGDVKISGAKTVVKVSTEENAVALDIRGKTSVSGGQVTVEAPAGQGIDAQGGLDITGGTLTVTSLELGIHALDEESGVNVSGGELSVVTEESQGILANMMTITGGVVSVQCSPDNHPIEVFDGANFQFIGGVLKLPNVNPEDSVKIGLKDYYLVNINVGGEETTALIEAGQPLPTPDAPEKEGYTFDGWYTAASGGTMWDFEQGVTAHMTVYARWTAVSYAVTVPSKVENGSVTVSKSTAIKDDTVTITVTPDSGYALAELTVTDGAGKKLTLTSSGSGRYTFTMPASAVTVQVSFRKAEQPCDGGADCPSKPYQDVDQSLWYHEYVDYVIKNGYMIGVSEEPRLFHTEVSLTRAEAVQTLYQMESSPAFTRTAQYSDVRATDWYASAVNWATENGIINGRDNGKFDPEAKITREELVTIIYRYTDAFKGLSVAAEAGIPKAFTDRNSVSGYATDAMAWAIDRGIINGMTATTLEPQRAARRCEMAKIITTLCGEYPEIP